MPALERAELDPNEPVRVGLRPMRDGNVCLEQEAGTSIVHDYGHGGFSLSWGCGSEVAAIVTRQLRGAVAPAA